LRNLTRIFAALIFISNISFSQTLTLQDEKSTVHFLIKNFGLTVKGNLKGLAGQFELREDSITKSYFIATVNTKTVDTGVSLRDKHLRNEMYFDAVKYPTIKISSKEIFKTNQQWSSVADVTIKGVTREISIPFTVKKEHERVVFTGSFHVDRRDFGVGANSLTLADDVQIDFEITGVVQ
jgi:polyisoprenoid-binding protein YceI